MITQKDINQQIKFAQKEILKAGRELGSANIRLADTKYMSDIRKINDALTKLNTRLVNDIRKM